MRKETEYKNIVVLTMILFSNIVNIFAQASLSLDDFKIAKGETKVVTIDLSNSVEIRALQVQVMLPHELKLAARPTVVPTRQGFTVDEFGEKIIAVKNLNYITREDGSCVIVVNASDAIPFAGTEGAIINLPLKVNEDAVVGKKTIHLKNIELVYADGYRYIRPQDEDSEVEIYDMKTSIEQLMKDASRTVDVYGVDGKCVIRETSVSGLKSFLSRGIYLIDGYKVMIE